MIKRVSLVRRKDGMSPEDFEHYWLTQHAGLSSKMKHLRRYVINIVDRGASPNLPWDGFSEVWFDSIEDMREAYQGTLADAVRADDDNFIGDAMVLVVHEHSVR
jgi:uncharacterized protein (TIGR02118 family)